MQGKCAACTHFVGCLDSIGGGLLAWTSCVQACSMLSLRLPQRHCRRKGVCMTSIAASPMIAQVQLSSRL